MKPPLLAALVVLLYAGLIAFVLHGRGWDETTFIVAGDRVVESSKLASPIAVLRGSSGYDGQYYYRLALDPFTAKATDFGITLDNPATRGARLGYPLLGWAASLGRPALLPWALIGVNLAGLFAIAWMATALARSQQRPAWVGLIVPLYPGFIVTLIRDLTEITAVAFGLGALRLALQRRFWLAALVLSLAVITRETTLFYLAGFGLMEAVGCLWRRRWSPALVPLLIPAVVFLAWQSFVAWYWGQSSTSGTGQNFGLPFAGMTEFFTSTVALLRQSSWRTQPFNRAAYYLIAAAIPLGTAVLAALLLLGRRIAAGVAVDWALYGLLIVSLTTAVWVEPNDYLRVCADWFVVSAVAVMLSRQLWAGAGLLALLLPSWALTAWTL